MFCIFWSKFGDSSSNLWRVIAQISSWLTDTRTHAGNDNTRRPKLASGKRRHGPLARYVTLRVAHAPGLPETFSTPLRVSDLDMHHGTCVTHVPWCMPRSLTSGSPWIRWRGKRSRHSRRVLNPQFYVSGKIPIGCRGVLSHRQISIIYQCLPANHLFCRDWWGMSYWANDIALNIINHLDMTGANPWVERFLVWQSKTFRRQGGRKSDF